MVLSKESHFLVGNIPDRLFVWFPWFSRFHVNSRINRALGFVNFYRAFSIRISQVSTKGATVSVWLELFIAGVRPSFPPSQVLLQPLHRGYFPYFTQCLDRSWIFQPDSPRPHLLLSSLFSCCGFPPPVRKYHGTLLPGMIRADGGFLPGEWKRCRQKKRVWFIVAFSQHLSNGLTKSQTGAAFSAVSSLFDPQPTLWKHVAILAFLLVASPRWWRFPKPNLSWV